MSQEDRVKEIRRRAEELRNRVLSLESRLNNVLDTALKLDKYSINLPLKLKDIRRRGYVFKKHLEEDLEKLTEQWMKFRHEYIAISNAIKGSHLPEIAAFKSKVDRVYYSVDPSSIDYFTSELNFLESEFGRVEMRISQDISRVEGMLSGLDRSFESINNEVNRILRDLNLLQSASFNLGEGEHLVECYKAKLMMEEKLKGYIFLTDRRLLFEEHKEVPVKKVLFIAVKKKLVKNLIVNVPVSEITQVSEGRVGLFEWKGVYVNLRDGRQLIFDLKDAEIKSFISTINRIIRGDIGQEKISISIAVTRPEVIKCPYCGAPVRRPIEAYSITCEYCGSIIELPGTER